MLKDALKFYHDSYLVAYCLEIVTPFAHIHGMCVFTWSWTLSLKLWVTLGNWMPPPWDCTWAWNVLVSAHLLLSHDSHITYVASPASPREMIGMWSKACLFWTSPTKRLLKKFSPFRILWIPSLILLNSNQDSTSPMNFTNYCILSDLFLQSLRGLFFYGT